MNEQLTVIGNGIWNGKELVALCYGEREKAIAYAARLGASDKMRDLLQEAMHDGISDEWRERVNRLPFPPA